MAQHQADAAEIKRKLLAEPRYQAWIFLPSHNIFAKVFDAVGTKEFAARQARTRYPQAHLRVCAVGVEPR